MIDKSKQEGQLILSILSKLGFEYVVFVSTFHIVKIATQDKWKMPKLDEFIKYLIHEKDKLIRMDPLNYSNSRAISMHEKRNYNLKPN